MKKVVNFWPVAVSVLGVFLFISGQVYRSGYLTGMAFLLFAIILTTIHNRHWERMKYRGQLIGFLVALSGLIISTLGYWQLALDPESVELSERISLIWISPGQFILLPVGLILFGECSLAQLPKRRTQRLSSNPERRPVHRGTCPRG